MIKSPTKQHDDSQDGEPKSRRRRQRGSAWHWKQTDRWYYTPPGTKKRVPLMDKEGKRIHGEENRQAAELALARLRLAGQWRPTAELIGDTPKVAFDHYGREWSQYFQEPLWIAIGAPVKGVVDAF